MRGFCDLHCHVVVGIDDGARTLDESRALIEGLHAAGFDDLVATPHTRPGMFDNRRDDLSRAFAATMEGLGTARPLPRVHLASEHWFDDEVFGRMLAGDALPYPHLGGADGAAGAAGGSVGGDARRGILVELPPRAFPPRLDHCFFDLMRRGLQPVLAHPERYQPVWKDDACLDGLLDAGALLLLDVCALVGKYGRASQEAAEKLLDEDAYEAACSDAHRPGDPELVARAIDVLEARVGAREARRLLSDAPRAVLGLPPL